MIDDDDIWHQVIKTVKPLKNPKPVVTREIKVKKAVIQSLNIAPSIDPSTRAASPMPLKQIKKLRQKKIPIDATIDLHGMTIEKAHNAVTRFLLNAYKNELRCIDVITGKGDPLRGTGLLKREFPMWLKETQLRLIVLHCEENPISRGGSYLVMLRRNKSVD